MSTEEKNEWLINYVNSLATQINEQYGNIVKKEHIDKAISMYKDSDKEIEDIKNEIDKLAREFIENHLKRMQEIREEMLRKQMEKQQKMLEQLRELNPNVQIDIQNEIKDNNLESKIISSIPKEQLKLPKNIIIDDNNKIINNNLSIEKNLSDLLNITERNSIINDKNNYLHNDYINSLNSYDFIKQICTNFEKIDGILENDYYKNKTHISIDVSKIIAKEIIGKLSSEYLDKYEEYINSKVSFIRGDQKLSGSQQIMYDDSIEDIYTIVHEFFHYYTDLGNYNNKDIPHEIKNSIGLLDEAKSMLSEELVTHILKNKIVDLEKYNIHISPNELDINKVKRLYGIREMSSMYIYFQNLNKMLQYCSNNNIRYTKENELKFFDSFSKDSVEYKSFLENINNENVNMLLNRENFLNNKIYRIYDHPFAYLLSLDLKNNINIENNDFSKFNELVSNIKKLEKSQMFNIKLIKDNKIDKSQTNYVNELLQNKKIEIKNIEEKIINIQNTRLDSRKIDYMNSIPNVDIVNSQKQQVKNTQFTIEVKQIKKESKPIPKQPSIPPKRQEEKTIKKSQSVKMNNFEKKAYPPLKQKQEIKKQVKQQVQNKSNVKILKNNNKVKSSKSGTSGNGSKGFVNIILGSIITIIIGLMIFILIK